MLRPRIKDLLLQARVRHQNLKTKISYRHLADFIEKLHQKACQACSIIIFPHSAIQIIDLLRCRCHCCGHFLNSLFFAVQAAQICNLFPENSLTGFNPKTDQNKTKQTNITRKNGKKLAHRRKRSEIFCWWFFLVLRTDNNYLTSCWWSDFATCHLNEGNTSQFHHFGFVIVKKDIIGSVHVRRI